MAHGAHATFIKDNLNLVTEVEVGEVGEAHITAWSTEDSKDVGFGLCHQHTAKSSLYSCLI